MDHLTPSVHHAVIELNASPDFRGASLLFFANDKGVFRASAAERRAGEFFAVEQCDVARMVAVAARWASGLAR